MVLFIIGWMLQAITLVTALTSKKPRAGGKSVIGLLVFFGWTGSQFLFMGLRGRAGIFESSLPIGFFGIELPWIALLLMCAIPNFFILILGAVRKMRSERASIYSKPQAVAIMILETVLILGSIWQFKGFPPLVLIVLYILSILALILISRVTPNLGDFEKGVRRAERQGLAHASYWHDLSLNRVVLYVTCLVLLIGPTIAWNFISDQPQLNPRLATGFQADYSFSIPIASAVLVLAYFGLALQYFLLVAPRRGGTLMGMFVFFVWIIPILVGLLLGSTGAPETVSLIIASLSPIVGLSTSSGAGASNAIQYLQAATLSPALIFFFLFNYLYTSQRRKVLKRIHNAPDRRKPSARNEAYLVEDAAQS
jgi:hypothetical protein